MVRDHLALLNQPFPYILQIKFGQGYSVIGLLSSLGESVSSMLLSLVGRHDMVQNRGEPQ